MYRIVFLALLLAGCATFQGSGVDEARELRDLEQSDMRFTVFRQEMIHAGELVGAGKLTRKRAADRINAKRLALFGRDAIDDAVFAHYRQLAAKRDKGALTSAQVQASLLEKIGQAREQARASAGRSAKGHATLVLESILE